MAKPLPRITPVTAETTLGSLKGQGNNLYLTLMNHPELHQKRLELGLGIEPEEGDAPLPEK